MLPLATLMPRNSKLQYRLEIGAHFLLVFPPLQQECFLCLVIILYSADYERNSLGFYYYWRRVQIDLNNKVSAGCHIEFKTEVYGQEKFCTTLFVLLVCFYG